MSELPHKPDTIQVLTRESLRALLFESDERTRSRFLAECGAATELAIRAICEADAKLDAYRSAGLREDARTATVERFLHSGMYSLVAALHHLACGYPVATGHMMRHFYESYAMAALCVDPEAQVLEAFLRDMAGYRVDQAPDRLRRRKQGTRLKELIGFDPDGWISHIKGNIDFGGRSHAAGLTLAYQSLFGHTHRIVIGGEYDPGKRAYYLADLQRIAACAQNLGVLAECVTEALLELQASDT